MDSDKLLWVNHYALFIETRGKRQRIREREKREGRDMRVGDWVHWHRLDGPHATGTTTTHDALRTTD